MHYVYILLLKNNDLYKGSTSDLQVRINDHIRGKVLSTKHKRPLRLIHYECYLKRSDALRRERFLKTSDGGKLLKQQLKDILEEARIKIGGFA